MRDLTKKEREFFEMILKRNAIKNNGYWVFRINKDGRNRSYKRSRILMQLHLDKKLEVWELVHHKDHNKENDSIENLEVLNASDHVTHHHQNLLDRKKPDNWKPANTLDVEIVNRIREIAKEMVRVNYSEVSRRLKREGIEVASVTVKKYLCL